MVLVVVLVGRIVGGLDAAVTAAAVVTTSRCPVTNTYEKLFTLHKYFLYNSPLCQKYYFQFALKACTNYLTYRMI